MFEKLHILMINQMFEFELKEKNILNWSGQHSGFSLFSKDNLSKDTFITLKIRMQLL